MTKTKRRAGQKGKPGSAARDEDDHPRDEAGEHSRQHAAQHALPAGVSIGAIAVELSRAWAAVLLTIIGAANSRQHEHFKLCRGSSWRAAGLVFACWPFTVGGIFVCSCDQKA